MAEPWQRLPALTLKQIQYFVTLAHLRHFTDTASRLAISQPALSSALRQIENVIGGKLINRTASSVTLTELGAAILPHAERILSVSHRAFSDIQQIIEEGGDGTLRIGLVPSVSSLLFPNVPTQLNLHFPRLNVEFYDKTNDSLVSQLMNNEIDFGVGVLDSSVPRELQLFTLQDDPFVAVVHREDILANGFHLPWKMLNNRDIAVFSKGNIQRLVLATIESHRLKLNVRYQVDYIETLYGLVRSKLAVAILPQLYTAHLREPDLVVLQLQQPALTRTVSLMRTSQVLTPMVESAFMVLLKTLKDNPINS
ncbi:LysR family transcriptional regulator [Providencia vermicola]|uniref:LysR family transcriptional regulator n=3 Tax=Providencia TaxID=586 RepID=A0AAI9I0S7_PROST|nr:MULTISPECIES: LysR family transcriptional regulator [Providencia]ELR5045119.1 LysR family transcriptional regulator [Providencia rettgeri]ELR5036321.1 LysR family transcriptional regulator [Providencia stuartii]ELR5122008.1 LysR family transcriptional regulator [Providencia stuartii]ELR5123457.1 LysR family transcriptional regulator [Providencia stuartii]ELR5140726.1 LysR family transcriptional regulator [Providencia stuartii]